MLKYIKNHMATIDGIEIYPIISLLIFFAFFTVLLVYIMKMDKGHVAEMEKSPLEDSINLETSTES